MQFNETATTGDLLAEISRLEEQVTNLSSQMESNQDTINLLKQSLADRDARIQELESHVVVTPKLLLQNVLDKILLCKSQIKSGIDEKIITPVLSQIKQQLQFIQRLTDDSIALIDKSKQTIQQNVEASTLIINQGPDRARLYIENKLVAPIKALLDQVIEIFNTCLKRTQHFITQQMIPACKSRYEQCIDSVLALPSQGHILFQVWAVEPLKQRMHNLADFRLADNASGSLKPLLSALLGMLKQLFDAIAEQVKKSPFWDGKRPVEAAA